MPIKIPGTYCPLCGDIGLFAAVRGEEVWAYCAQGATGPEDAHTAYVYPMDRLPAEVLEYLDLVGNKGKVVKRPTKPLVGDEDKREKSPAKPLADDEESE